MPVSDADLQDNPEPSGPLTQLPFPPITKSHILHCSYHYWHPRYRAVTPKSRLVPLSQAFVDYLRADGIVLPDEDEPHHVKSDSDDDDHGWTSSAKVSEPESEEEEQDADPSKEWRDVHEAIKLTIAELGGKVVPKLNWSAPKDATWINATNNMECRTPNDIYLLLKSSDFVTHDLEHAFDGCIDANNHTPHSAIGGTPVTTGDIPFHLVLRKQILFNPAVEFRCFVRRRKLLGMCQRDLNHYDYLFKMKDSLCESIQHFFDMKLRDTFPDDNFAFDVYIPPPHERVWLIDINPWAPRTDPLLFSWLELLTMREPPNPAPDASLREDFVRLTLKGAHDGYHAIVAEVPDTKANSNEEEEEYDDVEADVFQPELRLINKDDPEAYTFNTPQYSAHKLPRDVVEASQSGPGALREFAEQWKEVLERRQREDAEDNAE